MKKFLSILFFATFFLALTALAQSRKPSSYGIKSKKALTLYLEGNQNEQYRDYAKAAELYLAAIEIENEFALAYSRLMIVTYLQQKLEEGYPYMLKCRELIEEPNGQEYFYFGEFNFYSGKFEEAEKDYRKFFELKPQVKPKTAQIASINMRNANFAKEAIKLPVKYNPQNLGPGINSEGQEYMPYLTADGQYLFITARRRESTGGYSPEYRDFTEDFFYSELKDGKWQDLVNLGPPVNTPQNEGAASFSPDGQSVFFTACNRKEGLGSCDIFLSRLEGTTWSKPVNLGPKINSRFWDSQPCISNDGRTLYFVSSRPGGAGANDIWYSKKGSKGWGDAQNLGLPINTEGNENSPFLHADGKTFYFSSDEHPGFGGFDLFLSRLEGDSWGEPKNMGYPLNTQAHEKNLFVGTSGHTGFINSNQDGGEGGFDVYQFEIDENYRPEYASFVKGIVVNKETQAPLKARVLFIDVANGDTIRQVISNSSSGNFLISLPGGREYASFVKKKGYLFYSGNFSLKEATDEEQSFELRIQLEPIKEGAKIVLNNVFYESGKFELLEASQTELKELLAFLKKNKNLKIRIGGHTDNVGSTESNEALSDSRANSVKNYLVQGGIPTDRVEAIGYGESKPISTNDTDEGRANNRRTEFEITGL